MNEMIQIRELICPECKDELCGLPTDKVFTCRACSLAYFPGGSGLQPLPLHFAPSGIKSSHTTIYLPFWKIGTQTTVLAPDGTDVTQNSVARDIDAVWVCGFFEVRPAYFGNPGLRYTGAKVCPLLQEEIQGRPVVVGTERSPEEAKRYVDVFVTRLIDKQKDVSGYDITVAQGEISLWAMPFAYNKEIHVLHDLTSGFEYKSALVEYLHDILNYRP